MKKELSTENYKFFQNKTCEFFPCHKIDDIEKFNCLFCFCPLYMLKDECGGNFVKKNGVKDCSNCTIPHSEGGYEKIMSKIKMVVKKGSDFTEKKEI